MDLDTLNGQAEKAPSKRKFHDPISKLPDGKYCLTLTHSEFVDMAKFYKFTLQYAVEVSDQETINSKKEFLIMKDDDEKAMKNLQDLKATLKTIGLDVDNWTKANGRAFSEEFTRARPAMVGMQLMATKKTNESNGNTYVNVYFDKRILGDDSKPVDGKPLEIGAAEITAAVEADKAADPFK